MLISRTDVQKNISKPDISNHKTNQNIANSCLLEPDSFNKTAKNNKVISFSGKNFEYRQNKNVIQLVSFTGLNDPAKTKPIGLQFKVRGVKANQNLKFNEPGRTRHYPEDKHGLKDLNSIGNNNINRLADSDWKDGQSLIWEQGIRYSNNVAVPILELYYKEPGTDSVLPIGRMPDEIYAHLIKHFENEDAKRDFKVELSNVVAGTSKSISTIGLRANLLYRGKSLETRQEVQKSINDVLNDPKCSETAMVYQPKTGPEEVLKMILDHETQVNGNKGTAARKDMETAIGNIVREIESPKNRSILLVGHSKPDGDTIGCVLGLKNAIGLSHPEKEVDCAIDDRTPGLFRHTLPGIDGELKRPHDPDRIEKLKRQIQTLAPQQKNRQVGAEIEILQDEIKELKSIKDSSQELDPDKKYDLAILMDIPTPNRFTGAFKKYLHDDTKVIYIDHHPHRLQEWREAKNETGVDMDKIHAGKLSWIADTVPAAAQMIGIIAEKIIPGLKEIGTQQGNYKVEAQDIFKNEDKLDKVKAMVASLVTGISTDTGAFLRTANLLPEHMLKPAEQRPNFMPEGFSKWLMGLTEGMKGNIDKKWLREEINYDIIDVKNPKMPLTARETMLNYSVKGKILPEAEVVFSNRKTFPKNLGLGIVSVNYDSMFDVWTKARESEKDEEREPETTLIDVQNAFKYSEVMNTLRANPTVHGQIMEDEISWRTKIEKKAMEDYESDFDDDRIAVLIMQDKKAGALDEKLNIADKNGLRLSLRSQNGTNHAELLSYMFNGGGHGGASGGRVDLPGVEVDTKLKLKINGKVEDDAEKIFEALNKKYEIMNDFDLSVEERGQRAPKFELVKDEEGRTAAELITDVTQVIRQQQVKRKEKEVQIKKAS